MDVLPNDIIFEIISYIHPINLYSLFNVNKRLYNISKIRIGLYNCLKWKWFVINRYLGDVHKNDDEVRELLKCNNNTFNEYFIQCIPIYHPILVKRMKIKLSYLEVCLERGDDVTFLRLLSHLYYSKNFISHNIIVAEVINIIYKYGRIHLLNHNNDDYSRITKYLNIENKKLYCQLPESCFSYTLNCPKVLSGLLLRVHNLQLPKEIRYNLHYKNPFSQYLFNSEDPITFYNKYEDKILNDKYVRYGKYLTSNSDFLIILSLINKCTLYNKYDNQYQLIINDIFSIFLGISINELYEQLPIRINIIELLDDINLLSYSINLRNKSLLYDIIFIRYKNNIDKILDHIIECKGLLDMYEYLLSILEQLLPINIFSLHNLITKKLENRNKYLYYRILFKYKHYVEDRQK
ncbi:F-box domain-containing protein with Leucine-rich repeat [Orpheovirus IHUMI-LCC2]|uniref:F-box domain-containing protein with Leucine-rich repeat n=1 Tax=Orpheovirus IHUMI-LCC2 TaxID=2023057 RepID=A0A2I2L3E3_9VIRU|nr:F-box domain-containing protein with Leucine-rich repeat [Orpheovirus IHUMI-LCC2]SNW62058.1 F-box domain-containing protein with Leucine-rich repeat [Orpheovirus IHUMI-LCC2]